MCVCVWRVLSKTFIFFYSISFLPKIKTKPNKAMRPVPAEGLGLSPTFGFYCTVAGCITWIFLSYPQMGSALQVAQELQIRTAKCPAEQRCRHIVPCKQKAENCNIYLQSSVAAVCRCCFLLDPSVVRYTLPSGRKDIHCSVPFLI